jgi:hypothetical protein
MVNPMPQLPASLSSALCRFFFRHNGSQLRLGVRFVIVKRNGWREMTDGDVSHSSERRLDTCMKGGDQDWFSLLDSS